MLAGYRLTTLGASLVYYSPEEDAVAFNYDIFRHPLHRAQLGPKGRDVALVKLALPQIDSVDSFRVLMGGPRPWSRQRVQWLLDDLVAMGYIELAEPQHDAEACYGH
jgi:hypothetical protein